MPLVVDIFALGALEVHDARAGLRDHGLGLHEHLAVGRVEAPRDLARELEVLALVLAHRHLVGLVEQDVGGLEHRIEEQARPNELLLTRRLVLELGHPLQVAVGRDRGEQPAELRVLVHVGLAEQDAAVGVETGGHQHRRRCRARSRAAPWGRTRRSSRAGRRCSRSPGRRAPGRRDSPDRPDVVAEVLAPGRLDAAEDAHGAGSLGAGAPRPRSAPPRCSRSPSGSRAGRAAGCCRRRRWRASRARARPAARPSRSSSRARRAGRAAGPELPH